MAEKKIRDLAGLSDWLTDMFAAEVEHLPGADSEEHGQAERLKLLHLAAKVVKEIAAATLAAERAVRAIEALREANPGREPEDNEDMNDVEPADREQLYADLQSRLDRFAAQMERKRAAAGAERAAREVDVGDDDPPASG